MRGLRSRAAILTTVVVSALTAPLPAHAAGTGTPPPSPPPAISAAAPAKGAEAPATPADGPAKPAAAAAKPAAPPPAPASSARPDWLRAKSTPSADEEPAPSGWTASRVMALLLVAGLGGFALFQRRRRRAAAPIPGASGLRVLESARLGPKAYLVTAAVGRRVLVLGVTDQSVSRLAVLRGNAATEAETAREASPANDPTPRPVGERVVAKDASFATMLRSALGMPRAEKSDDLLVAASRTREVLDLGGSAPRGRARARKEGDEALIDVEAQAAGLVRRLKEKKP